MQKTMAPVQDIKSIPAVEFLLTHHDGIIL